MTNEIREVLDYLKEGKIFLNSNECKILLDYITNLQEENEKLKDLYRRTTNHLFKIGNDELARYFQAQINDCPSFVPQDLRGDE